MMIDEHLPRKKPATLSEEKEIKVRIPLDYHIKLHTVKVVSGSSISDTVKNALDDYFQAIANEAEH